jgi:hypothetical protein
LLEFAVVVVVVVIVGSSLFETIGLRVWKQRRRVWRKRRSDWKP